MCRCKREDVVAHLKEVIDAVHAEGGLAGIHCCGNTEWSILVDAGVDILNFDAFGFGETIAMYAAGDEGPPGAGRGYRLGRRADLAGHPGADARDSWWRISRRWRTTWPARALISRSILEQAIITPSCGTGSMEVADAEKVFQTLRLVSQALRARSTAS